ncbi:DUF2986 domain-containing protein [Shewanella putrefaciens]|uniref:DUF2986 domain-containing protein n=1 Tax=Shewanella putrefaciens TaxID=24 RepID=UPI000E0EFA91|nr:DUF2986 domain-containing protein [Shewanella putrefaciens]
MNRKKKINQTLKNKAKKANAKLQTCNKPKYIAKADREALVLAVLPESEPSDAAA